MTGPAADPIPQGGVRSGGFGHRSAAAQPQNNSATERQSRSWCQFPSRIEATTPTLSAAMLARPICGMGLSFRSSRHIVLGRRLKDDSLGFRKPYVRGASRHPIYMLDDVATRRAGRVILTAVALILAITAAPPFRPPAAESGEPDGHPMR